MTKPRTDSEERRPSGTPLSSGCLQIRVICLGSLFTTYCTPASSARRLNCHMTEYMTKPLMKKIERIPANRRRLSVGGAVRERLDLGDVYPCAVREDSPRRWCAWLTGANAAANAAAASFGDDSCRWGLADQLSALSSPLFWSFLGVASPFADHRAVF